LVIHSLARTSDSRCSGGLNFIPHQRRWSTCLEGRCCSLNHPGGTQDQKYPKQEMSKGVQQGVGISKLGWGWPGPRTPPAVGGYSHAARADTHARRHHGISHAKKKQVSSQYKDFDKCRPYSYYPGMQNTNNGIPPSERLKFNLA
jgi:hypothetical protein